jgi:hypothetical protein
MRCWIHIRYLYLYQLHYICIHCNAMQCNAMICYDMVYILVVSSHLRLILMLMLMLMLILLCCLVFISYLQLVPQLHCMRCIWLHPMWQNSDGGNLTASATVRHCTVLCTRCCHSLFINIPTIMYNIIYRGKWKLHLLNIHKTSLFVWLLSGLLRNVWFPCLAWPQCCHLWKANNQCWNEAQILRLSLRFSAWYP